MANLSYRVEDLAVLSAIVASIIASVLTYFDQIPLKTVFIVLLGTLAAIAFHILDHNHKQSKRLEELIELTSGKRSKMINQKEFYEYLKVALEKAQHEACLTHHEPEPPTISGIEEKKHYFETKDKIIKKKKVLFRQIVTIDNERKLAWIREMLVKYKDCPNFSLRIANPTTDSKIPRPSVQIIDNKEIFIINIKVGHATLSAYDNDFWTDDLGITKTFVPYFDAYWDASIPLKDGTIIYDEVLEKIKETMSKSSNHNK